MDVEQTFLSSGIAFTAEGTQFKITCPVCYKPAHCYVNQTTGAWDCKKCGESGGFSKLIEQITGAKIVSPIPAQKPGNPPTWADIDQRAKKLMGPNGTKALEYLQGRGITLDAIHHFRLGLERRKEIDWICIPYFENGQPVNIKYRSVPPAEKAFERWNGGKSSLFNQDGISAIDPPAEVILVEGELDCISMWCHGFKACVSTSLGAGSFQPEWVDAIDRFEKIIIMYDADEAGQKGAKKHGDRFEPAKVFNVLLPVKDANEFFLQGHDAEEMSETLDKAKPFDVDNIMTINQVHANLVAEATDNDRSKIYPQWKSVAKLTGPYDAGDLIIVTAPPKIGKTTWVLNDSLMWAKKNIPVLFYCLEMRPERLLRKCYQIHLHLTEDGIKEPKSMAMAYSELAGIPLYFGYNYKKCTLDIVVETIKKGVRRFGLEIVVFDNLHFLARSLTHQTQEIGLITKTFKLLAEELRIPIVMIAQPNRGEDHDRVVGIHDLKGSSDIGADCDQVIALWRKKRKGGITDIADMAFEPETLVRVDASRFRSGGETVLYFEGETGIFGEIQ